MGDVCMTLNMSLFLVALQGDRGSPGEKGENVSNSFFNRQ